MSSGDASSGNPVIGHARAFRDACGAFATGVAIVSARDRNGVPIGMVINSFTSLSLDPMWVQWAVARSAPSYPAFARASHFGVSILGGEQAHLVSRFTRGGMKFLGLEHPVSADQVPLIDGALATFSCRTVELRDAGDHVVIVGEVRHCTSSPGAPLLFHRGQLLQHTAEA